MQWFAGNPAYSFSAYSSARSVGRPQVVLNLGPASPLRKEERIRRVRKWRVTSRIPPIASDESIAPCPRLTTVGGCRTAVGGLWCLSRSIAERHRLRLLVPEGTVADGAA